MLCVLGRAPPIPDGPPCAASCIQQSVFDTKSWPRFRLERASTVSESPPFSCCISTLCPHACSSLLLLSLPRHSVSRHSRLAPRLPTSGQSTCLRRKPSFRAPTKVGGLRSCSVVHQPFNTAMAMLPSLLRPRKARQLRSPEVRILAALGDDSAAGAGAGQRQDGDGGGELASSPIAVALQQAQAWPVESLCWTVWTGDFCCF